MVLLKEFSTSGRKNVVKATSVLIASALFLTSCSNGESEPEQLPDIAVPNEKNIFEDNAEQSTGTGSTISDNKDEDTKAKDSAKMFFDNFFDAMLLGSSGYLRIQNIGPMLNNFTGIMQRNYPKNSGKQDSDFNKVMKDSLKYNTFISLSEGKTDEEFKILADELQANNPIARMFNYDGLSNPERAYINLYALRSMNAPKGLTVSKNIKRGNNFRLILPHEEMVINENRSITITSENVQAQIGGAEIPKIDKVLFAKTINIVNVNGLWLINSRDIIDQLSKNF